MLRLLRQKYRVFVENGIKPCLDSLMDSCSQLKANWSRTQDLKPVCHPGPGGGGALNISSVLRQQMRSYSKNVDPSGSDDNCGAPKECQTTAKEGSKSCGPAHFKGNICDMVKGRKPKKEEEKKESKAKKAKAKKFTSMWDIPGCEYEPMCDVPVRLDIAHYRITDKQARAYQVTWTECPRLVIKPKKVCIHQKHPRPKPCRRKRKSQAATARPKVPMVNPMKCKEPQAAGSCPRWTLPCCKPGRFPPSCALTRRVTKCTKRRAPYPSFSECKKEELTVAPPTECRCLATPMACEVWAEIRRRIARGKSAMLKCGEA
ncbi:uncharacterized protein LOC110177891 [Drosophila serrata]|uniref:uncharacterized protein LOC110177891 n=1 Tax=Drosophila serrata TaxID=7274 RepID=UPI000A1D335C|nr:uncharacterized protein LOC110177891 [Drosophila serrata]